MVKLVSVSDLSLFQIGGTPIPQCSPEVVAKRARACGVPGSTDSELLPMLIAALMAAAGHRDDSKAVTSWRDLTEEARALLILSLRREGCVSTTTADTVNLLCKPQVVERYKTLGNRWTIPESSRDHRDELDRARAAVLTSSGDASLRALGGALEEPVVERPWYSSKVVLVIVGIAALFVLVHVALLLRVLGKVHSTDNQVLMLPVVGLSASALVGAFAIGVNRLTSSPPKRKAD